MKTFAMLPRMPWFLATLGYIQMQGGREALSMHGAVYSCHRSGCLQTIGTIDFLCVPGVIGSHNQNGYRGVNRELRDVLDPADRHAGQIHLDQRLLDRALTPPVALDDRCLEGLRPKLWDLQPHLASLGLQLALIVARACILTRLAALVALRIAQPVRFGIQQSVQRLLHAPSHHPIEVVLDPLIVNRDDVVQRTRCNLGHGGSFSLTWLRLATSSSARFGAASPT